MAHLSIKLSSSVMAVRPRAYGVALRLLVLALVLLVCATSAALSAQAPACPTGVDPTASTPLKEPTATSGCATKSSHGFPLPDPACTPGAINATVTLEVLQGGQFRTGCERNRKTTAAQKNSTYAEYRVPHPQHNTGAGQSCELDHLVSLELGGADSLDNIWPQCGPDAVALAQRFFKIKDGVENYLAVQVRTGKIDLAVAQHGIAEDWTQYVAAATAYWSHHSERGFGRDD